MSVKCTVSVNDDAWPAVRGMHAHGARVRWQHLLFQPADRCARVYRHKRSVGATSSRRLRRGREGSIIPGCVPAQRDGAQSRRSQSGFDPLHVTAIQRRAQYRSLPWCCPVPVAPMWPVAHVRSKTVCPRAARWRHRAFDGRWGRRETVRRLCSVSAVRRDRGTVASLGRRLQR